MNPFTHTHPDSDASNSYTYSFTNSDANVWSHANTYSDGWSYANAYRCTHFSNPNTKPVTVTVTHSVHSTNKPEYFQNNLKWHKPPPF
jgi:hypothetical protein